MDTKSQESNTKFFTNIKKTLAVTCFHRRIQHSTHVKNANLILNTSLKKCTKETN